MPLTPNSLLQSAPAAKAQSASANSLTAAAKPEDSGSSFSSVYAKEAVNTPAPVSEGAHKGGREAVANKHDKPSKQDAGADKAATPEPTVADSGNTLPVEPVAPDNTDADADSAEQAPVVVAPPADPALDPALMQAVLPVAPAPVPAPSASAAATEAQARIEAPLAAAVAAQSTVTETEFDPEADPLDALPVVRLAMEQSGHVSASSQGPAKAAPEQAPLTPAQNFANGMASMLDQQAATDSSGQGGEKTFTALLDDGLKDLKGAASDTRVDDFASRLANLTQATTAKTANAVPVNQPLAMHQSGWTEEVVNRVMYLSSVNLKSADIQLEPAELGRLDIRVNMATDQPTQVSFMSGHAGVREALEGQMFRLREMFTQQGMGQVDVNVSDQNRGQEQAHQGQNHTSPSGARRDAGVEDDLSIAAAEAAPASGLSQVIGTSAVDYYA